MLLMHQIVLIFPYVHVRGFVVPLAQLLRFDTVVIT